MATVTVRLHKVVTDVLIAEATVDTADLDEAAQRMYGCPFNELGDSEQAEVVEDVDPAVDGKWDYHDSISGPMDGVTVVDVQDVRHAA